jgi:Tfp pilus assembly protein PilO
MNKSKKMIIICLFPALLTIIFMIYVMFPCIGKLGEVKDGLDQEKADFSQTQDRLISVQNNKKLSQDVQELRSRLADFDVKVPDEDDMAVLLVDLDKFARSFNARIISLNTDMEKNVEIIDPKQQALNKKRKVRKLEQSSPIQLTEIPLEVTVIGLYPDLLNFINALEHYQRKVSINGVSISDYKEDREVTSSKVQLVIKASIYKLTRQVITKETNSNESSKEES